MRSLRRTSIICHPVIVALPRVWPASFAAACWALATEFVGAPAWPGIVLVIIAAVWWAWEWGHEAGFRHGKAAVTRHALAQMGEVEAKLLHHHAATIAQYGGSLEN